VEAEGSGIATRKIRLNQRTAERYCARRCLGTEPAIASSADMNRDFRDAIESRIRSSVENSVPVKRIQPVRLVW
jgi:hypothetical protein